MSRCYWRSATWRSLRPGITTLSCAKRSNNSCAKTCAGPSTRSDSRPRARMASAKYVNSHSRAAISRSCPPLLVAGPAPAARHAGSNHRERLNSNHPDIFAILVSRKHGASQTWRLADMAPRRHGASQTWRIECAFHHLPSSLHRPTGRRTRGIAGGVADSMRLLVADDILST
jgi:hypothetical protein